MPVIWRLADPEMTPAITALSAAELGLSTSRIVRVDPEVPRLSVPESRTSPLAIAPPRMSGALFASELAVEPQVPRPVDTVNVPLPNVL